MAMNFSECESCGSTEQETMLTPDGNCVPCQKVLDAEPEDGLPLEAVMRLTNLAESRHPTACHEDAPRFRQVLEQQGFLPESPQG